MTDIYLVSDTHFGHKNIIDFCGRPFVGPRDMNETMIENWNSCVKPKDIVWHLGDFGFKAEDDLDDIYNQLNGTKHLLLGNHDENNSQVKKLPWASVGHYKRLKWEGKRYILSHYPFQSWHGSNKGDIHFHGHCHGTLRTIQYNRLDVGVDCHVSQFFPVKLSAAVQYVEWQNENHELELVIT